AEGVGVAAVIVADGVGFGVGVVSTGAIPCSVAVPQAESRTRTAAPEAARWSRRMGATLQARRAGPGEVGEGTVTRDLLHLDGDGRSQRSARRSPCLLRADARRERRTVAFECAWKKKKVGA